MNKLKLNCKLCRRAGKKLFLKGERCFSAKCAIIKKPFAPGQHSKKAAVLTDYGKQLAQKQTLKRSYGLRERQFKNYFTAASKERGAVADALVANLETRLDNVIYRICFAESRDQARQLVGHGFFEVNGKPTNIPSMQLKKGDIFAFKASKAGKVFVQNVKERLSNKKNEIPGWLELDGSKLKGKLVAIPGMKDVRLEADPQTIIEYYSR